MFVDGEGCVVEPVTVWRVCPCFDIQIPHQVTCGDKDEDE